MVAIIWEFFVNTIWPLIWPIVRDFIMEAFKELLLSMKVKLEGLFRNQADDQTNFAEKKAQDAERSAAKATDDAERVRAEAEAKVWKKVAEELKFQNESLQQRLKELFKEATIHSTDLVEAASTKKRVEDRIFNLSTN